MSVILVAAAAAPALSEETKPADLPAIELLQEEVLNTIALDRPVHFVTPEASPTVAQAGGYWIHAVEPAGIKLIALADSTATVVDALTIAHAEQITEPVALYVKDDEKFPHVVLLMPGGKGLEAVGSYDDTRTRGLRTFQLTPIQIQKALE